MADNIGQLNQGLTNLLDALQSETMAASKVRFGVLGFDNEVRCYLEPSDLRELEQMPELVSRGSTSFAALFRDLRQRIPADVAALKARGHLVNRPAVFMLTDGEPNPGDEWETTHHDLTNESFAQRPNLLAFGIGNANAATIRRIASRPEFAFISASGVDTGHAIAEFGKALTQSVISSGQALAEGLADLPVEKPEGFISLAVDTV